MHVARLKPAMPILERHEGCPPAQECFGPAGPYWSFLGTPVQFLWMHALAGIALALLLLAALLFLRRTRRLSTGPRAMAAMVVLAALAGFLLAAVFVPYSPIY
jgi:FtsH-binding integral membrane protein